MKEVFFDKKELARNLVNYKKANKLNDQKMSNITGVSPYMIYLLSKGEQNVSVNTLNKLFAAIPELQNYKVPEFDKAA